MLSNFPSAKYIQPSTLVKPDHMPLSIDQAGVSGSNMSQSARGTGKSGVLHDSPKVSSPGIVECVGIIGLPPEAPKESFGLLKLLEYDRVTFLVMYCAAQKVPC